MRCKANSSIARIWASFHSTGTTVMYNKSNFSPAAGIVYHPYLKGRAGRFFGPCRHSCNRDSPAYLGEKWSAELANFVEKCLVWDVSKRWSVEQLMEVSLFYGD